MINWTENAKEYFDKSIEAIQADNDDESLEFAEDIRLHIEAELVEQNSGFVTEAEIKRRLQSVLGYIPLEKITTTSPFQDTNNRSRTEQNYAKTNGKFWSFVIWAFGIILPLFTLAFELVTRVCADSLFNPLPTTGHVILIALVPIVIFWNLKRHKSNTPPSKLSILSLGAIISISLYNSIPFVLLMPFALIGIIAYGFGLLPLAPSLSLLAEFGITRKIIKANPGSPATWKRIGIGFLFGLVAITLVESPRIITRIGLSISVSEDTEKSLKGVNLLRVLGSEKQLLEACLPQFTNNTPFTFWKTEINPSEARIVYYRVTGKTYPEALRESNRTLIRTNTRSRWDSNVGDQIVGSPARDLKLATSRIDGVVESGPAHGYMEWTMEFVNNDYMNAEARGLIELPAGGVISRATLWIDGEEREAAFSTRRKAVAAYKKVVKRRRDPLLVTTKGLNKALIQCFPIPRDGGKMKIRLGITFPLHFQNQTSTLFTLPKLVSKNFEVSDGLQVPLWIESHTALTYSGIKESEPSKSIKTQITFKKLSSESNVIKAQRDQNENSFWSKNPFQTGIIQTSLKSNVPSQSTQAPIIVLDGSANMKPHRKNILKALKKAEMDFGAIIIAEDEPVIYRQTEIDQIDWNPKGGRDNSPSILTAIETLEELSSNTIIWIHGNQSIRVASIDGITRQLERRPRSIDFYSFQIESGSNFLADDLEKEIEIKTIPNLQGSYADSLISFLKDHNSARKLLSMQYDRFENQSTGEGRQIKDLAARLWAYRTAKSIYYSEEVDAYQASATLASNYQLVTASTGAVVLENQQQYEEADLEPGKIPPPSVSVPDNAKTALMLALSLLLLSYLARRIKAQGTRA